MYCLGTGFNLCLHKSYTCIHGNKYVCETCKSCVLFRWSIESNHFCDELLLLFRANGRVKQQVFQVKNNSNFSFMHFKRWSLMLSSSNERHHKIMKDCSFLWSKMNCLLQRCKKDLEDFLSSEVRETFK